MLPYPWRSFQERTARLIIAIVQAAATTRKVRTEALDPVPIMTTSNVLAVMATPPTFGAGRSFSCRPYQWSQQR